MTKTDKPPKNYRDAIDELETILEELESDELDIDLLSAKVKRAALLLEHCRTRLDDARVEVERVVAELRDADT